MTLAYYSVDEVNQFLVSRWAKRLTLEVLRPRELSDMDDHSVVLLDLDFLPPGVSLEGLLSMPRVARPRMIVHGHNITDDETGRLRANGVQVCRGRLRKRVLLAIRRPVAGRMERLGAPVASK